MHFQVKSPSIDGVLGSSMEVELQSLEESVAFVVFLSNLGIEKLLLAVDCNLGSMSVHFDNCTVREVRINHVEIVFFCLNGRPP